MHGIRKMNTLAHPLDPPDATLTGMLSHFTLLEPVFDAMPDVVFFVKDAQARYALVNRTLAAATRTRRRCSAGPPRTSSRAASGASTRRRTSRSSMSATRWSISWNCICTPDGNPAGA
jgi:hypothetical protein